MGRGQTSFIRLGQIDLRGRGLRWSKNLESVNQSTTEWTTKSYQVYGGLREIIGMEEVTKKFVGRGWNFQGVG